MSQQYEDRTELEPEAESKCVEDGILVCFLILVSEPLSFDNVSGL